MNNQFYRGMVTDSGGDELTNEAYLTFGSETGEGIGDCEITIKGARAKECSYLISATSDLLHALEAILAVTTGDQAMIETAQNAIDKARGKGMYKRPLKL